MVQWTSVDEKDGLGMRNEKFPSALLARSSCYHTFLGSAVMAMIHDAYANENNGITRKEASSSNARLE